MIKKNYIGIIKQMQSQFYNQSNELSSWSAFIPTLFFLVPYTINNKYPICH